MKTDTAHLAWNDRWNTPHGRAEWLTPEPDVAAFAAQLATGPAKRVLDLGCGVGRHALAYARLGLEVTAVDMAESGISELRRSATAENLEITTMIAAMTELPFADHTFDHVLSFNVIYHGDPLIVGAAVREIARVLKPGGTYQGTMLSKRNAKYGKGEEIAPNTFVEDAVDPEDSDKIHPHYYCNAAELVELFSDFELLSLIDREHVKPGSWHWHMLAELR
jgi:SAM-dependent methyltransferase